MKTGKDCMILIGEEEEVEEEIHQNLNIPTEIFIVIFSFLDYNTLVDVNRSCKIFHEITITYKTTFPVIITRIREREEKNKKIKRKKKN
ncbi:unnamed protein product [marine sediment metagenome]|uniref:F-box domain-containing protein n=1 Tax=marine sediment metagenome TaxID=412755 RepID=X1EVL0_9ZZZZ